MKVSTLRIAGSKLLAALFCMFVSSTTTAAPVLIDFSGGGGFLLRENLVYEGITFSPSCHLDMAGYMGFDMSGCHSPTTIRDGYLGPHFTDDVAKIYVLPPAGTIVSLLGLQHAEGFYDVRSSRGGFQQINFGIEATGEFHFTGPEWTNIAWLEFSTDAGDPVGFSSISFDIQRVDEPSSIALLGLSALGLMSMRKRREHQPQA